MKEPVVFLQDFSNYDQNSDLQVSKRDIGNWA